MMRRIGIVEAFLCVLALLYPGALFYDDTLCQHACMFVDRSSTAEAAPIPRRSVVRLSGGNDLSTRPINTMLDVSLTITLRYPDASLRDYQAVTTY